MISVLPKHIHFLEEPQSKGDRVFINITSSGCGSGCSYCYIDNPRGKQELVDIDAIDRTARVLCDHFDFRQGPSGTIISLCPDSDPFKDSASTSSFERLLREVIPLGNPIQIPTKEVWPLSTLSLIARLAREGQVVAFTSFSTISKAAKVEPGAASISDRFENFNRTRSFGVHGSLYLKPFLPATIRDLEEFIRLTNRNVPDSACIGILYSRSSSQGQARFNHPVHGDLRAKAIDSDFELFVSEFRQRTSVPVFHSSVCVSAYLLSRYPKPMIWRVYPELCVNCRDCESDCNRDDADPRRQNHVDYA